MGLGEAKILHSIGIIYQIKNETSLAINFYNKSLDLYIERGDSVGRAQVFGDLGNAYRQLGYIDTAIKLLRRSLIYHKKSGVWLGVGKQLFNLGVCFWETGNNKLMVACCIFSYNLFNNMQVEEKILPGEVLERFRDEVGEDYFKELESYVISQGSELLKDIVNIT